MKKISLKIWNILSLRIMDIITLVIIAFLLSLWVLDGFFDHIFMQYEVLGEIYGKTIVYLLIISPFITFVCGALSILNKQFIPAMLLNTVATIFVYMFIFISID